MVCLIMYVIEVSAIKKIKISYQNYKIYISVFIKNKRFIYLSVGPWKTASIKYFMIEATLPTHLGVVYEGCPVL